MHKNKLLAQISLAVTLTVLIIVLWAQFTPPAIRAATNTPPVAVDDSTRMFAITASEGFLYQLNPATYASFGVAFKIPLTMTGFTIAGANGLAIHPTTKQIYIILKVNSGGRRLATLNPLTGVATDIGNMGDNFSSLAFTDTGVLYATTGDGAAVPETLYTINPATAAKTLVLTLGNGADGEVIGFNPDDGLMYHASGNSTQIWESINLTTLAITNIPRTGFNTAEIFSLAYIGNNTFRATDISSGVDTLTTSGVATSVATGLAADFRGIISTPAYTTIEDTLLTVTTNTVLVNDADVNADPLTAIIDTPPAHAASFTLNPDGSFSYMPAADYCGVDSFTYHANDGLADSNIATGTITVTCVPDSPKAVDDTPLVAQNSTNQTLSVLTNDSDADGDPLIITAVSTPNQGGTAVNNGTTITYTPANGFFGTEVFTYDIDDGTGRTDTASVTVTVNAPPVALDDAFTVAQDSQNNVLTVLVGDSDPDNGALTITAVSTPNQGGSVTHNGTVLTYTPAAGFSGQEVFTYTINDGSIGNDTAQVTVTVTPNQVDYKTYLAFVANEGFPDLVIDQILTTGGTIQVVIRKQGQVPVTAPFWVDLYIDPTNPPTRVNQIWQTQGGRGAVWGVINTGLPIPVGGTLTLSIGDAYYRPDLSSPSLALAAGTALYAQVDSANTASANGAILETHERVGGPYNNILGPVSAPQATNASLPTLQNSGDQKPVTPETALPDR